MKYRKRALVKNFAGILIALFLLMTLALSTGCTTRGANIRLREVSLGEVTMGEQPVAGLPSEKIDLLLEVAAQEISIIYTSNSTTLTLSPSGATLEITANGVSINGIKPEQMKVSWAVNPPE